jgi:caa(3)-type oxidase subunit IV
MGQAAHANHDHAGHGGGGDQGGHGAHHAPAYYVKIWALLLALLIVSIMGPMLGNKVLTVITAFGIAIVKALIVAAFFMHLNIEKRYVWYMLFGMLAMVTLFWFGVAADINKFEGRNWTKVSSAQYIEDFKKRFSGEPGEEPAAAAGGEAVHEGGEAK